jgi:hypothetical protein
MTETGRPMPLTERLMAMRGQQAGVVETALARAAADDARQAALVAANAPDPDERCANLLARGYAPGQVSELARRLGDTQAQLEGERAKIARGERRREQVRAMLEHGQLGGLEAAQRMDGDFGDPAEAGRLERRVESLRAQLLDAQELMMVPEDRAANAVEAAAQRAQRVLADVAAQRRAEDAADRAARERMKADRAAFRRAQVTRPFAGGAGAGEAARARSEPLASLEAHSSAGAGGPEPGDDGYRVRYGGEVTGVW